MAERTGIVVAGLRGGSGKSVVAVGLAGALAGRGLDLTPFKKGPDYIDAGWLSLAAGRPCRNLDPYLMEATVLRRAFLAHAGGFSLVEGNRGLFDGVDVHGSGSTGALAHLLGLPVLLVVDCTKVTRTVAALVRGCQAMDPDLPLAGVVGNRLGTGRQLRLISQVLAAYTDVPFFGAIPRQREEPFPMRHLGVTPHQEHAGATAAVATLARLAAEHLDLAGIVAAAGQVPGSPPPPLPAAGGTRVRLGVVRDAAFQFYYPENLEALEAAGAELVFLSALDDGGLPPLDGLYIGGGFPETAAPRLAANQGFRQAVGRAAAHGMPIYAECGGLIFLGRSLEVDGTTYPMAGVFPADFDLCPRPQAHGYTALRVVQANPFYPEGTRLRGHEFRYSRVRRWDGGELACAMERGVGFAGGRDGLVAHNVLALYTHVHALATPEWAPALVARARAWREAREGATVTAS